ncbi:uncharacterized protein mylk4b [Xenentodon cancila]
MNSSLVNSLAKVYDPNPLHGQKLTGRKLSLCGSDKFQASASASSSAHDASLRCVENKMDSLTSQMEYLLNMQQTVLTRLDSLAQDVRGMGQDLVSMREEGHDRRRSSGVEALCREMFGAMERTTERIESQGRRLEGVEKLVEGTQQVISFVGEVVKNSKLVEVLFRQPGNSRKGKDDKDKAKQSLKGVKTQKKRKPQDLSDNSSLNEPVLQEQVEKLNRQNIELSQASTEPDVQRGDASGSGGRRQELAELILNEFSDSRPDERGKETKQREDEDDGENTQPEKEEQREEDVGTDQSQKAEDDMNTWHKEKTGDSEKVTGVISETCEPTLLPQESSQEAGDTANSSKRRVTEEDLVKDDLKKSRVDNSKLKKADGQTVAAPESVDVKVKTDKEGQSDVKEFLIDSTPPALAPFDHRIVTPKPHQIATYYTIDKDEVLGGGRFGQVHKCIENSSGLTLAAKIIKARSQKEKEVVRNEIQVMNQLSHANLIQLYAAFESRHDIILVMEYVEGGELFDRIIDENYNLTELDTVLFIRQICEGLQYMHKMYILHLDLKPENILCVNRATNKIKIIDFGLARRYKPREKLRVNFGTPEFLAPEVINYEFVSFPTDMWSLGVITYMLLSGLSPFLGDDDNETLNNILACQWNFEEQEFTDISDEAKDFITRLLVKSKSWRMSATESLKHPWLSDRSLHYRLNQKKNKCHSSHPPPPES